MGLGTPPDTSKVHDWLAARPATTFKLDSNNEWTPDIMRELAATGAVRVVDIKGHYSGDWLDNTPVPEVYAGIAQLLPDVIIEDPKLTDQTTPALGEAGLARIAYDAPIHSLDDLLACDPRPARVNIKPTRFGAISSLLETIEWCETQGIPMYGGGQFELAWGRTQVQTIAAIFYPDAANDVAPSVFHSAKPGDAGMPDSPLTIPNRDGFGFPA
jgi:O-succinylbenzoate synthase